MSIGKIVLARLLDVAVISLLIFGNESFRDFAVAIVWFIVVMCSMGLFIGPEKLKDALGTDRGIVRKIISIVVAAGYVFGLIYSGHPTLAATYAMLRVTLLLVAGSASAKEAK